MDVDSTGSPTDCGIDIAVSDLDGKGAHGVYTERSRSKKYHGKEAVIEYVKMLWRLRHENEDENENHEVRYHHIDAPSLQFDLAHCKLFGSGQAPVEVEAHFRPLFLDSPLRNCRLQRWFFAQSSFCFGAQASKARSKENEQFGVHDAKIGEYVIPTPAASFNAVYQLAHICRHLFDEGIGLRQLLDYYFVLRALHIEQGELADMDSTCSPTKQSMAQWAEGMGIAVKSNEEIIHTLSRFGMKKFAGATMYVLQSVFEAPLNPPEGGKLENTNWQTKYPWMICEPNEKEGKFLLNEIMQAGNFGKYDDRIKKTSSQGGHAWEKLKHNFRLIRHYPEEVLWEPVFRVYHWVWRKLRLWRF